MHLERLLVVFSIASLVFALGYAVSNAITTARPPSPPALVRPTNASALVKKLDALDTRLHDAHTRIDEVMLALANAREDSERDASRVRLDVLFRLESGLTADIARTRAELARVNPR